MEPAAVGTNASSSLRRPCVNGRGFLVGVGNISDSGVEGKAGGHVVALAKKLIVFLVSLCSFSGLFD